ncbi:MAG TPA: tyrosine-type recombinase/integrase [Xanthobacteraceae bacterium]|nr:tyrosine-type recombinase/integrase [Xanthobacteraceae bacterium]
MTRIRLEYIHEYRDRHGKLRRYFRRPGFKRVALPGLPGSDEFMAAYQLALAGQPKPIGVERTRPGTVNATIVGYYTSLAFRELAAGSQRKYRNVLERFREEHGDKRIASLPRDFIVRVLGKKPRYAARNWFKAIRALMKFAVAEGFRADDPTADIALPALKKSAGIHPWTEDEIAQYEATHAIGTKAHLAFALLLYTGQRLSDVIRMGRQHVHNGAITVRQQKTGAPLQIPIREELQRALGTTAGEHLTFLVNKNGKPYTASGFGDWFRRRCDEAELPQCSAHGLRHTACTRLANDGRTTHQIAAISGHKSLSLVERYTKAADQERLARQAFGLEQKRTDVG